MNSEVHFEVLEDERQNQRAKAEAIEAKEARISAEASEAISFDRHPFWQIIKKDLGEVRERLLRKLINDVSMTEYDLERCRWEIKNIDLFLNHPKLYVKRLQDLIAKKRSR